MTAYNYNERGWLTSSSSPQFSMGLQYHNGTYPQYNGNISGQSFTNNSSNTFTYQYDKLNRLTSGAASGMSEVLDYDLMANIKSLNRDGTGAKVYNYTDGNRLESITGLTGLCAYDANGNATTDGRNGVTLSYNHLSLPTTANKSGLSLTYIYNATGAKLRKVSTQGTTSTTDYVGGIQYTNNVIDFIQTEEGIARKSGGSYIYEYNLGDHLGNIRATFKVNGSTVEVLKRDNYYAFGMRKSVLNDVGAVSLQNKYLYNGKELQEELEQYDYGARFYDPVIGRWNVVDPLAEKMRRHSPYNYVFNNPMRFIDPDGMEAEEVDPQKTKTVTNTFKYDDKGKTTGTDYITSTSTTYYTSINDDGSVTSSSYKVSLTATVDRDGNIGDQVSQTITTTTETRSKDADGNPIIVSGSYKTNTYEGKMDYKNVVDSDLKAGASSVSSIKKETGLSPLQNLANYQNGILSTPAKVRGAVGVMGTIAGYFSSLKGLKGGPVTAVAGVLLYFAPKSDPERLSKNIKIK